MVVQGFFVGMVANLIPFVPGGVGAVDAGLIGTFVLFGLAGQRGLRRRPRLPVDRVLAADPAGIVAFFQLRRTVARWQEERAPGAVGNDMAESLPGSRPPAHVHYFRK